MKILFSIVAIATSLSVYGQITFQHTFGSFSSDRAVDVITTSDGGYAVLVESMDFDPMVMSAGAGIVKLNAAGDTLWTSGFIPSFNNLTPISISETADNGFVIGSHTGGSMIMIKTDANGNMEWNKSYEPSSAQTGGAFQTSDGGYMIAGNSYGFGAYSDFFVVKTDALGDTLWTRSYDTGESDLLYSANPTADGGCILGGKRQWLSTSNLDEFIYMKIDANGNLEFSKVYSSNWADFHHTCYSIKQTADLGYIAVGSGDNYSSMLFWPWAVRLDVNGNQIWAGDYRDVGSSIDDQNFMDAAELADGSIVAVGKMSEGFTTDALSVVKLSNVNGAAQWRREYMPSGNDHANAVTVTPDGGVIVAGSTQIPGVYSGAYVLKTDTNGMAANCFVTTTPTGSSTSGSTSNMVTSTGSGVVNVGVLALSNQTGIQFHKLIPNVTVTGTDPLCDEDCNGSGFVSATDGQGSYDWLWSTGGNLDTEIGLCPSLYFIDVTDAAGCTVRDSIELVAPTPVSVTGVVTNVTCNGDFDGAIDITVSGGVGTYTFDWPTGATTEDLSGLGGGFYQVDVQDSNGCDEQYAVVVVEPLPLGSFITTTTNATCNGICDGELATITTGGTSPYTYLWNDPSNQTTSTAGLLCPGTYLLTTTDDNGCVAYVNGVVTEPDEIITSTNASSTECGLSSGSAWVTLTGGTMPYTYDWSGMGTNDTLPGLNSGWYDVLVTDDNGCTKMDSALVGSAVIPVDICVVTVDSTNQNVINWTKPVAGNIDGFKIYRNVAGVYTPIGYRDYDSLSYYVDTDFGVDPTVTSYRYKISVVDTCGAESDLSGFHETIHLTSNVGVGGEVNLIWDNYEGFSFGFYRILRDSTGTGDWEILDSVAFSSFTFTDNDVPIIGARYLIEVVTPSLCDATKAIGDFNSSRSNSKATAIGPNGIEEGRALNFKLYPNPAKDRLFVEADFVSTDVTLRILDYTGKLIHSENHSGLHGRVRKEINISDLPAGYYIFETSTAKGVIREKFVKH